MKVSEKQAGFSGAPLYPVGSTLLTQLPGVRVPLNETGEGKHSDFSVCYGTPTLIPGCMRLPRAPQRPSLASQFLHAPLQLKGQKEAIKTKGPGRNQWAIPKSSTWALGSCSGAGVLPEGYQRCLGGRNHSGQVRSDGTDSNITYATSLLLAQESFLVCEMDSMASLGMPIEQGGGGRPSMKGSEKSLALNRHPQ